MGQRTERRMIGSQEFITTQLPAMKALALSTRLGRAIGPALAQASGLSGMDDVEKLGPAITALFSTLDGAETQALARDILCMTQVVHEGKLITLDSHAMIDAVFTGRLGDLFTVIRFALEVNFRDFFDALTTAASAALTKAGSDEATPASA